MRAHLPLRLIRTTAFAAVCVLLAALAHWLGGGARPEPWALTAGGGAVFVLAAALGGRERSPAVVGCLLATAQLGLHELFGGADTGYVTGYVMSHPHGQGLGEALGMLVAHLTATLLTGWWLARGEAALWALLRRLVRRLLLPRPVPPPPAARPLAPVVRARRVPADPAFRHSLARRGPPLPA
ncbi:MFS transporter [Nonomuraea sp. NPDC048826]|uniref:MFS transporter n=1 Tax=Nonomuraea sp. NPDC048826 TaxID=3364347 RepID=UPI003717BA0B